MQLQKHSKGELNAMMRLRSATSESNCNHLSCDQIRIHNGGCLQVQERVEGYRVQASSASEQSTKSDRALQAAQAEATRLNHRAAELQLRLDTLTSELSEQAAVAATAAAQVVKLEAQLAAEKAAQQALLEDEVARAADVDRMVAAAVAQKEEAAARAVAMAEKRAAVVSGGLSQGQGGRGLGPREGLWTGTQSIDQTNC